MSQLKLSGDASGTGIVTVAAPNTNNTYTVTLPAAAGTLARTDAAQTFTGTQTFSSDASVNGLTVGRGAGSVSTNTAVGASALSSGSQTGTNNTAVGYQALQLNVTGARNTGIGVYALQIVQGSNSDNTALGYSAGYGNMTNSTAVGSYALGYFNGSSGDANIAVGNYALYKNYTGNYNTSIGYQSLYSNFSASNNTAVGYQAGYSNTGADNLFLGHSTGYNNTTGTRNTFVGRAASFWVTAGSDNTSLGYNSGGASGGVGVTGSYSTSVGSGALQYNTASNNTAVGYQALNNSTGADNTSLGYQAGDVITTGTGNVIIGKGADPSANSGTDQIVIGNGVTGQANTNVTIGNGTGKIYNAYTVNATWTQTSDGTMKNVIGPDSLGLSFINRLNPILFTWKAQNDLPPDHPYYAEENKRDTTRVIHGFVAQEVKAALDAEGCSTFNGWDQGDDGIQAISREMFISPLVKAVQELSAQVEQLKAELAALKGA